MFSNPNQNFDERQWIINILRNLEEDQRENETEIPVCIFSVPKMLMSSDPVSLYTPQEVAIGPYHRLRPELYEMERYKLAAAKRAQRQFRGDHKLQCVVDQLKDLEPQIRACYQKFLKFSSETLAWMMVIDASFLLEFLQIYAMREDGFPATSSSSISHLVDYAGMKAAHNAILRDMLMLENQIPLFVLRKMLQVQYSSLESADDLLRAMLIGLCEDLSPFKMKNDKPMIQVSECAHLVDYLYNTIVPKAEQQAEITEIDGQDSKTFFTVVWKFLSKMILSRPIKVLCKFPCFMLSKIPGFSILTEPVQNLIFPQDNEENKSDAERSPSNKRMNKPPLVEEITIPSVTELSKVKVRFSATVGNTSTVRFDTKTATLHLPTISFDVYTEVILRNLVAYEASNASGPLVLSRYSELMNGIVDNEKDVKLLRENGIVLNRLKSDAEVANLWNGMSKSIRLTKVPHIDIVIEGVNKYYNSRWRVKYWKNKKLNVFGSWQFLTLIATIMLLLLTALQAFCSVYDCRKHHHGSSDD